MRAKRHLESGNAARSKASGFGAASNANTVSNYCEREGFDSVRSANTVSNYCERKGFDPGRSTGTAAFANSEPASD